MLMLEAEGLCFQKIQEWQSAPDRELLHCWFSGGAGPETPPLALHRCGVCNSTCPQAGWSLFSIKNLSNSVLCLLSFYQDSYRDINSIRFALFSFLLLALRADPNTPKVLSEDLLDKFKPV